MIIAPAPPPIATHTPSPAPAPARITVQAAELLLGDWFAADVVMTSSGRAGILLYLEAAGFNRYCHQVALPRMISACVLEAVIPRAFILDAAGPGAGAADLALLYHQYGIPQAQPPDGPVLEDICHAFFAAAGTGARRWTGDAAVFSLPKFFPVATMAGGLAVHDVRLASELRTLRDRARVRTADESHTQARVFQAAYENGGGGLDALYLARLTNPRIGDTETGGFPECMAAIRAIGERRAATMERLLSAAGAAALPAAWAALLTAALPFACPVFAAPERLGAVDQRLRAAGIRAGIYRIDVARRMAAPQYREALLLPCHHMLSESTISLMCRMLAE